MSRGFHFINWDVPLTPVILPFLLPSIDQLVEIIKVLGTPTREQIKTMNPNYMEHKFPQIKVSPPVPPPLVPALTIGISAAPSLRQGLQAPYTTGGDRSHR